MLSPVNPTDLRDVEYLNLEDINSPLFGKIIDLLPVPIWVLDLNYRVVKYNRATRSFYNRKLSGTTYCYQLAQSINIPCRELGWFCPLEEVKNSGKAVVSEQQCLTGDETLLPMEICALPVIDQEGQVVLVAEILFDVSERIKYLEMLKRYEVISENARDIILMMDLEGRILEANSSAVQEYGYTRDELLGLTIFDIRTPQTNSSIKFQMKQAEQNGIMFETMHRRKDGTAFPVEVNSQGVDLVDERIILSVIRDITERKLTEENLSWEAEVNSALADLSGALVSSVTVEEIANLVLDKGKRLTGSKYGFVGFLDERNGYLISPTMSRDVWEICDIPDKDIVFKKIAGLWGWVINNKESLLTNTPQEDPRSGGVPDGHIPVHRFLAAPAMLGDRLVGIVALANSDRDYNSRDLALVQRMASTYALAISRKWDDERITKINECFLNFSSNPNININSLTSLCGELFGATCAVYNRLDNGLLCSWGQWNTPPDYNPVDKPEGHICYDLIKRGGDHAWLVRDLPRTGYAKTDPNLIAGGLQTYLGQPVKLKGIYIGAICVVFNRDFIPTESDKRIMGIICSAIGVEEERKMDQMKSRKNEERQKVELAILSNLANFRNLKKSILNVLDILTGLFNCEAAAIRLFNGEDYTYFAHTGFSAYFVKKEFSLCSCDENGVLKRDSSGNPQLECLCGKVLRNEFPGNIDDKYLTGYGSFLTGQASSIASDINGPLSMNATWRLTCPESGYETIALIPIKYEGNNIGLLQLNSKSTNAIIKEDMNFLELISRHIASAVRHLKDATALRESEERYRRLAENAPDVIYRISYDSNPHFEYISLATERLTGYTPEQFYHDDKLACKAIYPEDIDLMRKIITGETADGEPVELRWKHKNGQIIWMEHRNQVIRDLVGKPLAIEGIARDITEQKAIESARLERMLYDRVMTAAMSVFTRCHNRSEVLESLLDILLDNLNYGVGVFYTYNEWSNKLEKVITRPGETLIYPELIEDEAIKKSMFSQQIVVNDGSSQFRIDNWCEIFVPVYYQDLMQGVIALAAGKAISSNEVKFLEQVAVHLGITLHGIKQFEDLKTLSSQLAVRQKEIEIKNRELEYANRAKSEFLTNMSHELRTPLNSVIGFSELLERKLFGELNDRQLEYVMDIKESGEHLLSLINDILDLSKIEAGAMELDLNDIYLPDLLHGSIRMLREKGMKKGIKLNLDMDENVDLIKADSRKIKQIIFNLLSNALKFTPNGGSVTLSAVKQQDCVQICVSDTGIGVSEEDQSQIFREFAQVDGSLSRRHEGTGLGLALTKKLVGMHGGKIWVESKLGVGSKFIFCLPAEPGQQNDNAFGFIENMDTLQPEAINEISGKIPLVLVVEDDDRDASLVEIYLKNEGYRVVRAANGQEGYEMANKLHPQLITLDILMPIMDGWGLLQKLKANKELKNIPVLIISVVSDHKKGMEFGASEVLVKPFDPGMLLEIMRRKLGDSLSSKTTRTILVIDDDPKAIEIITQNITGQGYRTLKAYGGVEGINMAREEKVDLILLDLMMPEVDGFEVLRVLKQDPKLKNVPVIVLTAKILSAGDYEKLKGLVVAVKEKGAFSHSWLLSEINKNLHDGQNRKSDGEEV